MDAPLAVTVLSLARVYGALGAVFVVVFETVLLPRVDAHVRGSSILFRFFVLPAAALLWPLVLWRSLRVLRRA
jgi:hypothetical protein